MSVKVITRKGYTTVVRTETLDKIKVVSPSIVTRIILNDSVPMPFPVPGEQGPPGEDGEDGQDGQDGQDGTDGFYVHTQGIPATTWNVAHNLGFFPNVSVVDSSNRKVIGDVEYIDTNNLILTFSAGFSGKAYIS